jgi:hypothetical protein
MIEKHSPIFSLVRVQYDWNGNLKLLNVKNNILIMGIKMEDQKWKLHRIDLEKPLMVDEIELPKGEVHKIHLSPSGKHAIISLSSGENYYLFSNWKRVKQVFHKLNKKIDLVSWSLGISGNNNNNNSYKSTGPFLFTSNGHIYESELEPNDEYFKREEKYLKLVFSLNGETITGLHLEMIQSNKYFVLLTTLNRIYQFIGKLGNSLGKSESVFESFFTPYTSEFSPFQELPVSLNV